MTRDDEAPLIGIVGGSGLYDMDGIEDLEEVRVETPFGDPSDAYVTGRMFGRRVAFLPRHGRGHRISPSEINFRANVHGFKKLGADALVSISAVGSLRERVGPGSVVVPDQFIDRTRGRVSTFFGDGVVAHVAFADPFCAPLSGLLADAADFAGADVTRGGTYVCMEGPQFSTRAESHLYRSWGGDVIGMTNVQEAKLAREAEICFATLAMVTDYDCWRDEEADVEIADILAVLRANADMAKRAIALVVRGMEDQRDCGCRRALEHAVITDRSAIPERRRTDLAVVAGRVLGARS
jgi:5'-methylthioadenosine phosphorylase